MMNYDEECEHVDKEYKDDLDRNCSMWRYVLPSIG